jgi:hypothetical protein
MKTIKFLFLTFLIFFLSTQKDSAQNEYLDYKIQDTVSNENFTIFNLNDFRDALVQLGINVYKWNMPIPEDKDYKLEFYLQEYEKTKLVKDTMVDSWSTKYWGFDANNRAEFQYLKNLRIISEMPDWKDKTDKLRLRIALNSGMFQFGVSTSPRPEYGLYYLRKFEDTEFKTGKNIPLLLFTAGWEANSGGKMVRQFCSPNMLPSDLNDKSLADSDHYFVIGYRVVDTEFYGRD